MSTTNRKGFTLIEVMVVVPIALILISVLVYNIVQLTNSAALASEKTARQIDLNNALQTIEKDASLSKQFLAKPQLHDHTGAVNPSFVDYADSNNPQLTNSVRYGVIPRYDISDRPPSNYNQQSDRLLLHQVTTVTNNDINNIFEGGSGSTPRLPKPYHRVLAHFAQGHFGTSNCQYNPPVFINIIYYISGRTLYRRTIMPRTVKSGKNVYDHDIFCRWRTRDAGGVERTREYQLPADRPTCTANLVSSNSDYCYAEDQVILHNAEMTVQYFNKSRALIGNGITDPATNDTARQNLLDSAVFARVTLTSRVGINQNRAPVVVKGQVTIGTVSSLSTY